MMVVPIVIATAYVAWFIGFWMGHDCQSHGKCSRSPQPAESK